VNFLVGFSMAYLLLTGNNRCTGAARSGARVASAWWRKRKMSLRQSSRRPEDQVRTGRLFGRHETAFRTQSARLALAAGRTFASCVSEMSQRRATVKHRGDVDVTAVVPAKLA
jgi:phage tail tape-measure protein